MSLWVSNGGWGETRAFGPCYRMFAMLGSVTKGSPPTLCPKHKHLRVGAVEPSHRAEA